MGLKHLGFKGSWDHDGILKGHLVAEFYRGAMMAAQVDRRSLCRYSFLSHCCQPHAACKLCWYLDKQRLVGFLLAVRRFKKSLPRKIEPRVRRNRQGFSAISLRQQQREPVQAWQQRTPARFVR